METTKSKTTETFKVNGNWEAQSKQLKKNFPQLTDSDLKFETGKESELLGRIETRLNKNREAVIDLIKKGQTEKVHPENGQKEKVQPEKAEIAPAKVVRSL